jgi:hypothetical protein
MKRSTMHLTALGIALAVLTSGCAAKPSPQDTPSASAHTAPTPSFTPGPLDTGQIPVPGQDIDAPVNGFDPRTVFELCRTRVISDYPSIPNYRPYARDDVSPARTGTGVDVQLPFGTLSDGSPEGIMVCELIGTPAAPEISYTGPIDV